MNDDLLTVTDLTAGYGHTKVLRGISLRVGAAEAIGLLGPNGHGKTTLLRCVSNLHRATSGSVAYAGSDTRGRSPRDLVRRGLIHVPQGSRLFPQLTVAEALRLSAASSGHLATWRDGLDHVFTVFPRLKERRGQLTGTLSGGERQMVSLGMGLMARPTLLILDEPTLGLSPKVKHELSECILRIRAEVSSIILVDGDMELVLSLTDRYHVVLHGDIVHSGASDATVGRDAMMSLFLGGSADERR
ncbi:ABC transporter ATP-binding protein [Acrocarpospora macrocephala]|uniref:ABC transporter ATP-binding protein n=1 Tax=Acrocarpospora macrocephala TaxID=150177 RepID=A0A5M3WDW3_9ACTN|nr:ABC transporter ATP-binding protein [Acrocarpospora macrocephala]GES07257.1 ABC transporter ATP-binding protein [Acrocarpospora macrocephala]